MEQNNAPKDVFLHLLGIITLYISTFGLLALLFQYINIFFPDPLSPIYYDSVAGSIRWAMASLIIIFPVYILVSRMLNQDYRRNPEKRNLKIRKWLLYFTLFLAAIIIITDLVTLVFNFLGGDLTTRFLLKVLSILAVIGTIFWYYLSDLKETLPANKLKYLTWAVSAVVLVSVVFGFFTAGSPLKARLYRFDQRRVSDLQTLQDRIVNYWIQKDELPGELSDLEDTITGFTQPNDPATGLPYRYIINGDLAFELCATFDLSSEDLLGGPKAAIPYPERLYEYQQNWDHEAGETCFQRIIDPELYRDLEDRKPLL